MVLGLILGAPSLSVGFFMDDFAHRSAFLGMGEVADMVRSPVRMFSFSEGIPENTRLVIDSGLYPWWTSETVLLNFWRPLTAATHAVDYALWPNSPSLMHAQSLFWFCVTILAVAGLFRRVGLPVWPAGLAGLLFVVDESHAIPVAWIANRNALLALFFGVMCVSAHIRWRESEKPAWLIGAMALLTISVHCNEGGIATCGYLFAYAVFLDKAPLAFRFASLIPYGVIVVVWRVAYSAMGFGALGSPTYIDPGATPIRFVEAFIGRAPVLLASQFANLPGEPFVFLPASFKVAYWALSMAAFGICAIALWPFVRESRRARFWALAVLLSVIPASSTFPSGRLLVFASVGGAGLLSEYLIWVFSQERPRAKLSRAIAYGLIAIHIFIAPFALVGTSLGLNYLAWGMQKTFTDIDYPDDIGDRRLVIINAPNFFFTTYANVYRTVEGLPVPQGTHLLAPNAPIPARMTVTRVDEDTLYFAGEDGFRYMLFRDEDKPFAVGDRIELTHLTVEVLEVDDVGHAMAVHYHFPAPLESPTYCWMQMDLRMKFEPYTPLGIGETQVFYGD